MFLHLGGDTIIMSKELVAIIDSKTVTSSDKGTFIKGSKQSKKAAYIGEDDKVKSVVITDKMMYYSPISASTLRKRANNILNWIEDVK